MVVVKSGKIPTRISKMRCPLLVMLVAVIVAVPVHAQKKPKSAFDNPEDEYYKILRFEVPPGEVLEPGAIEVLPDGKVAVGTRRGEIWLIDNAYADDPKQAK